MKIRELAVICAAALGVLLTRPTSADSPLVEPGRTCSLTLRYLDSVDGEAPIAGAEFTYYRVASMSQEVIGGNVGLLFRSLVHGGGHVVLSPDAAPEEVERLTLKAWEGGAPSGGIRGQMTTDTNGRASVTGLLPGIYLVRETRSAAEHLPSGCFLVALPFTVRTEGKGSRRESWSYDAVAEPKPVPCGDLVVAKTVRGAEGEEKRGFHFRITLEAEGRYRYSLSTGEEGTLASGDVISLRSGDSVTVHAIPAGTTYQVTEEEADRDGYRTTSKGAKGRIRRKRQASALFLNERITKPLPAASSGGSITQTTEARSTAPVKTGDREDIPLWGGLCGAALLLLVLAGSRRKGGKRE